MVRIVRFCGAVAALALTLQLLQVSHASADGARASQVGGDITGESLKSEEKDNQMMGVLMSGVNLVNPPGLGADASGVHYTSSDGPGLSDEAKYAYVAELVKKDAARSGKLKLKSGATIGIGEFVLELLAVDLPQMASDTQLPAISDWVVFITYYLKYLSITVDPTVVSIFVHANHENLNLEYKSIATMLGNFSSLLVHSPKEVYPELDVFSVQKKDARFWKSWAQIATTLVKKTFKKQKKFINENLGCLLIGSALSRRRGVLLLSMFNTYLTELLLNINQPIEDAWMWHHSKDEGDIRGTPDPSFFSYLDTLAMEGIEVFSGGPRRAPVRDEMTAAIKDPGQIIDLMETRARPLLFPTTVAGSMPPVATRAASISPPSCSNSPMSDASNARHSWDPLARIQLEEAFLKILDTAEETCLHLIEVVKKDLVISAGNVVVNTEIDTSVVSCQSGCPCKKIQKTKKCPCQHKCGAAMPTPDGMSSMDQMNLEPDKDIDDEDYILEDGSANKISLRVFVSLMPMPWPDLQTPARSRDFWVQYLSFLLKKRKYKDVPQTELLAFVDNNQASLNSAYAANRELIIRAQVILLRAPPATFEGLHLDTKVKDAAFWAQFKGHCGRSIADNMKDCYDAIGKIMDQAPGMMPSSTGKEMLELFKMFMYNRVMFMTQPIVEAWQYRSVTGSGRKVVPSDGISLLFKEHLEPQLQGGDALQTSASFLRKSMKEMVHRAEVALQRQLDAAVTDVL